MLSRRICSLLIPLLFASSCVNAALGAAVDFTGLDANTVSSGTGQTFPWTLGPTSGTVTLTADWNLVYSLDGSLRTAAKAPADLANPFIGTLNLSFSEPVQVSLLATMQGLLTDGIDGGRIERVSLSTAGDVVFQP
ncbi:MAG TPA: hypothetical protein VE890_14380, partial [Thermoguttaceae bacterium]|nr:hypothetical protein [Thermoguttaceae bacterium]